MHGLIWAKKPVALKWVSNMNAAGSDTLPK